MAEIKNLIINGKTYAIADTDAINETQANTIATSVAGNMLVRSAVMFSGSQSLNDSQKLVARENIGAADADRVKNIDEILNGNQSKYIDGETCVGWTSATGTTWTLVNDDYQWLIVPVKENDVVDIGTNKTNATYALLLKSFSTPVVGEMIDFADAVSGYTVYDHTSVTDRAVAINARMLFPLGHEITMTIPDGVNYLLLSIVVGTPYPLEYLKVNGAEEYGPSGVVEDVSELGEKVDALTEDVNDHSGKIGTVTLDVTENRSRIDALADQVAGVVDAAVEESVINIDNPYVRAYLMNTQYSTDEWDTTNGRPYFTREDVSAYSQYVEGGKDKATPVIVNIDPYEGALGYRIIVSEDPGYTNAKELSATTGENKITWLKINRVYWVKTIATTVEGDVVLREKTIETHGARRLNPLTSVQNMRDLGGQTTVDGKVLKQGLLYRSATLAYITDEDKNLIEDVLDIKLVVGLADNKEDETLFSDKVETYNTTVAGFSLPHGWTNINQVEVRQQYVTYLKKIIEYLAQGKAVLIHCNGGADRTGLMSAIIEGLCGVSENDICKDYELTSFSVYSDADKRMLSRTRLGEKQADGTYRQLGFDSGIWYTRAQSGETFADQWKAWLQVSALATDGFEPLTDAEIEVLRKALLVEK